MFAVGLSVGLLCAGLSGLAAYRSVRRELSRAVAESDLLRKDGEQARERLFRLLAANQSEAIRVAIGADPPDEIRRREQEDARFRASFCSSD
jgi:hypothetical protein